MPSIALVDQNKKLIADILNIGLTAASKKHNVTRYFATKVFTQYKILEQLEVIKIERAKVNIMINSRYNKYSEEYKKRVIKYIRNNSVKEAAKKFKIPTRTIYNWIHSDKNR